uniref:Peroxin-7 n=1 Tax=Hyaloperonospora arabidopsidis (strain Emoy2) TaxID=559515 RepID=M4C4K7_HYAAE
MRHPAYSSPAQVDAVAAYALPHALFTDVEEAHDQAHSNEGSLLAIAQSQLEGNVWNGHVTLVQASHTNEQVCGLQLDTGVGALDWCGAHQDTLVLGCDDGDVRLAQLGRTDGAVALIPIIGAAGGSTEQEDAGVRTGKGHDDIVTGVNGSRVSKTQLATCSWDLTVKLWDIEAMNETISTLEGHTDLIWDVAMHPTHAPLLCSASQDMTVQLWDARRPQSAALVVSTLHSALSVDWHPTQSTVFSVGLEDGTVCTFDIRSPHTPLARRETHGAAVHVVKYSPYHDDLLATGGDDGKAFVTSDGFSSDRAVGRELLVAEEKGAPHRDYVRALDWFKSSSASDGEKLDTMLATGSWDKSVHTWGVVDYTDPIAGKLRSPAISETTMTAALPDVPVA